MYSFPPQQNLLTDDQEWILKIFTWKSSALIIMTYIFFTVNVSEWWISSEREHDGATFFAYEFVLCGAFSWMYGAAGDMFESATGNK